MSRPVILHTVIIHFKLSVSLCPKLVTLSGFYLMCKEQFLDASPKMSYKYSLELFMENRKESYVYQIIRIWSILQISFISKMRWYTYFIKVVDILRNRLSKITFLYFLRLRINFYLMNQCQLRNSKKSVLFIHSSKLWSKHWTLMRVLRCVNNKIFLNGMT
jgi:hypothetical protein